MYESSLSGYQVFVYKNKNEIALVARPDRTLQIEIVEGSHHRGGGSKVGGGTKRGMVAEGSHHVDTITTTMSVTEQVREKDY